MNNYLIEISISTIVIVLCILMYRWHTNPNNSFSLIDAIVGEDGKFSLFRAGQAVALIVSTWAFVILVERNTLTEYYFYGYMGVWSGINLAKNLLTKASDGSTSKN